jgi:dTDP-4-amino-4,6-dideoxygalactose transaminase
MDARALMRWLRDARIQTRPLWQPLHRSAAHAGATVLGGATAERLNATALSLPCSVGLTAEAQAIVVEAVRAAANHAPASEVA